MTIEEKATALRDKFNYLVKQYKKVEKKKTTGGEQFVVEGEEIKKQLALFFKEYGNFIKSRKNSFGTFDYDNYVVYLRRNAYQEKINNEQSPIHNPRSSTLNLSRSSNSYSFEEGKDDKSYGELYREGMQHMNYRSRMMESPFINQMSPPFEQPWVNEGRQHEEYMKRTKYTNEYYPNEPFKGNYPPIKQHHAESVGVYHRKDYFTPSIESRSPGMHLKPPTLDKNAYETNQPTTGFYEKYVNKKVTVYDFIKDNEDKSRSPDLFTDYNPYRNPNIPSPTHNSTYRVSPVMPQVNSIYNSSLYNTGPPPPPPRPVFRPIDHIHPPESLNPHITGPFSPVQPPLHTHVPNTPLWRNQFFQRETFKLQSKSPVSQQPVRVNTYKGLVRHNERKNIADVASPAISSSTSEDYPKYFLEDLLKETGKHKNIPVDTSDLLYEVCDGFFEHVLLMAGALASNANRKSISSKDVKLILKTEFDVELPDDADIKIVDS